MVRDAMESSRGTACLSLDCADTGSEKPIKPKSNQRPSSFPMRNIL